MRSTCGDPACTHHGLVETCPMHLVDVGCHAHVVSIGGDRELRRRLMELGFCSGTPVDVLRRAPFGDPIEFRIRGYCLSLRDEQAKYVTVNVPARA